MNYDRVPRGAKWMLTSSFFHAAYEALLVNELRYLQLVERKVSYVKRGFVSMQADYQVWFGYPSTFGHE